MKKKYVAIGLGVCIAGAVTVLAVLLYVLDPFKNSSDPNENEDNDDSDSDNRNHTKIHIDPSIMDDEDNTIPGSNGTIRRPVGKVMASDGSIDRFVLNELVMPSNETDYITHILDKYAGVVIDNGIIDNVMDEDGRAVDPFDMGEVLVRVDLSQSTLDDFDALLPNDDCVYSSVQAAQLIALLTREEFTGVSPNVVEDATAVLEHPLGSGQNLNAEHFWYLNESGPVQTNVIRAWDYLRYQNVPERSSSHYQPIRIGIIDAGFAFNVTTGEVTTGNADFGSDKPWQYNAVDGTRLAGGVYGNRYGALSWHGQGTFGTCCANAGNSYGTAGTSGGRMRGALSRNYFCRRDRTGYSQSKCVAILARFVDVINISWGGFCHQKTCTSKSTARKFASSALQTVVVVSAGNAGRLARNFFPCTYDSTICVGAIDERGERWSYSNYGPMVDIWAPAGYNSTLSPDSVEADADDIGGDELMVYGGTSQASPFVAGVVAMMKRLDPDLPTSRVRKILKDTSRMPVGVALQDANMTGYIDALGALQAILPNKPPSVSITLVRSSSANTGVTTVSVKASDPEMVSKDDDDFPLPLPTYKMMISISSNLDGHLCTLETSRNDLEEHCSGVLSTIGTHIIVAKVEDSFGATGQDSVTHDYQLSENPPRPWMYRPLDGSIVSLQDIQNGNVVLEALWYDPDQSSGHDISWDSNIDGYLGTGVIGVASNISGAITWETKLVPALSIGSHDITLTVIDEMGLVGVASLALTVVDGDGFPTVEIISPSTFEDWVQVARADLPLTFVGIAFDAEDGDLSGTSLEWYSDIDGFLGTGNSITVDLSFPECGGLDHVISLTATDSHENKVTDMIEVVMNQAC